MAITDIITLFLSFFFMIRGYSRGFMHSLTIPFSMIVATTISIIYYQATGDIIASSVIGLIGPLILNLFLKFLLKSWARATNNEIRPGPLSRWGGALLTLAWGWVFIIFTLILLTVLPPWGKPLTAVHDDVSKSASYLVAKPLENFLFAGSKPAIPAATGEASNNDVQTLAQDPRFQKILQDPDVQKEIDAHDIAGLMRNPKMMTLMQQIMSDPETMKRVIALYKNQSAPQETKNP